MENKEAIATSGPINPAVCCMRRARLFVRVRPQQVAEQPRVRHVGRARDALYLLQRLQLRRQPAVHAQDLRARTSPALHGRLRTAIQPARPAGPLLCTRICSSATGCNSKLCSPRPAQ